MLILLFLLASRAVSGPGMEVEGVEGVADLQFLQMISTAGSRAGSWKDFFASPLTV